MNSLCNFHWFWPLLDHYAVHESLLCWEVRIWHILFCRLNNSETSLIYCVFRCVILLFGHLSKNILVVSSYSFNNRDKISSFSMVWALNCEERMILKIRVVSLIWVGMSANVKTNTVVDHWVEVVMHNEELIEAFWVFSTTDERIMRERDNESTRFSTSCEFCLQSRKRRDGIIVAIDNVERIEGDKEQWPERKSSR